MRLESSDFEKDVSARMQEQLAASYLDARPSLNFAAINGHTDIYLVMELIQKI